MAGKGVDSIGRRNTLNEEVAMSIRKRQSDRSGRAPLASPQQPLPRSPDQAARRRVPVRFSPSGTPGADGKTAVKAAALPHVFRRQPEIGSDCHFKRTRQLSYRLGWGGLADLDNGEAKLPL
jgi:hypothetical protein